MHLIPISTLPPSLSSLTQQGPRKPQQLTYAAPATMAPSTAVKLRPPMKKSLDSKNSLKPSRSIERGEGGREGGMEGVMEGRVRGESTTFPK